jgi:hypothetical protein
VLPDGDCIASVSGCRPVSCPNSAGLRANSAAGISVCGGVGARAVSTRWLPGAAQHRMPAPKHEEWCQSRLHAGLMESAKTTCSTASAAARVAYSCKVHSCAHGATGVPLQLRADGRGQDAHHAGQRVSRGPRHHAPRPGAGVPPSSVLCVSSVAAPAVMTNIRWSSDSEASRRIADGCSF